MALSSQHSVWSNALAAYDQANLAFTNHGGWTRVEEVVTGTIFTTVWRSPVIQGSPQFHIGVYRNGTAATSQFRLLVFEGWSTATKSVIRPAPSAANGDATAPAADFSFGGGTEYPLYSASALNAVLFAADYITTNATSFSVCVTARGAYYGWSSSASAGVGVFYVGAVDSLVTVADPVPVGHFKRDRAFSNTSDMIKTRWTRYPTVTATQQYNWGGIMGLWTTATGQLNGALDRLYNSRAVGSRLIVGHAPNTATNSHATLGGPVRGLVPDLLEFTVSTTVFPANGDTMLIGADVYEVVAWNGTAGWTWLVKQSAA